MSKHTPRPWKIDTTSQQGIITVVSPWTDNNRVENSATFGDYRGSIICQMEYNNGVPTKEQAEANACLIATAPELLEALKEVSEAIRLMRKSDVNEHCKGVDILYKIAQPKVLQAIDKAEGG